ncbi:MAG: hypothetical protein ACR2QK_01570 [Acidimicrobiales bacterium]
MVRVIVFDALEPVFAVGLVEVLRRDGHDAHAVQEFDGAHAEADVLVVGADHSQLSNRADWPTPERWRSSVLLICQCVTAEILSLASEQRLSGVIARCSPLSTICAAVVAVSRGLFVFPTQWASLLAADDRDRRPNLTDLEKTILTAISAGTIDQLASKIGYSRRHTQRVVNKVLRDLGLPDTRSALIAAGAWGLVAVPPGPV